MRICQSGLELLKEAIVTQAAHDYKRALEKGKTVPTKLSESIEQLEDFFLSDYFSLLTKLSGQFLIERIKTEHQEKLTKRMKRMVRT